MRLKELDSGDIADSLTTVWSAFSLLGLKRRNGFPETSEMLVTAWTRLLRTLNSTRQQEKLYGSFQRFLGMFISKCLHATESDSDRAGEDTVDVNVSHNEGATHKQRAVFDILAGVSLYCHDVVEAVVHEQLMGHLQKFTSELQTAPASRRGLERRLAWLIQLLAALCRIRTCTGTEGSTLDLKEIEACAGTFKLMSLASSLYIQGQFVDPQLELAFIAFCSSFRKDIFAGLSRAGNPISDDEGFSDPHADLKLALQVGSLKDVADILLQKL